jgi:hypothetical protein
VSLVASWLAKTDAFQIIFFQHNRLAKIIEFKSITRSAIRKALAMLDNCPAASAARRAGGSNGYR